MSIDPLKGPAGKLSRSVWRTDAETEAPAAPNLRNAIDPQPVEWDVAVRAAYVLLADQVGPSGSGEHPAILDMARDLAARLCAYDEIVRVVEQQDQRAVLAVVAY